MADSRSPREKRASTNNPEAFCKGEVKMTIDPFRKLDKANATNPWRNLESRADRGQVGDLD